jgi:hypothetical protein
MPGWGPIGRFAVGELPVAGGVTQPYGGSFSSFSAPRKAALAAAVIATTFVGFIAPPPAQAALSFTSFSQPAKKPVQAVSWNFVARPASAQTAIFTQFSQPGAARTVLPDEQPSALFEVLPPVGPPFTGFSSFDLVIQTRSNVALHLGRWWQPIILPADTHDLVFMGDQFRKKKRKPDLIDEELRRKAKLRADLELAIYGPEIKPEPVAEPVVAPPAPPPNVDDLTRIAMDLRSQSMSRQRRDAEQDDEDVLEMILKDLG